MFLDCDKKFIESWQNEHQTGRHLLAEIIYLEEQSTVEWYHAMNGNVFGLSIDRRENWAKKKDCDWNPCDFVSSVLRLEGKVFKSHARESAYSHAYCSHRPN